MPFDYSKLRGRIVEICGSQSVFAEKMETSERTLSLKMTGKIPWRQDEICRAIDVLGLDATDIPVYFFTLKVQNVELS